MKYAALLPMLALAFGLAACSAIQPNDLAGRWQVQQIADTALGDGVDIWIEVNGDTATGFTGCSDFNASVTTFETNVSFSPPAKQPGECTSAAAATDEARFLGVLPSVRRYVRHGRSLELLSATPGEEALIRLRLTDETSG